MKSAPCNKPIESLCPGIDLLRTASFHRRLKVEWAPGDGFAGVLVVQVDCVRNQLDLTGSSMTENSLRDLRIQIRKTLVSDRFEYQFKKLCLGRGVRTVG